MVEEVKPWFHPHIQFLNSLVCREVLEFMSVWRGRTAIVSVVLPVVPVQSINRRPHSIYLEAVMLPSSQMETEVFAFATSSPIVILYRFTFDRQKPCKKQQQDWLLQKAMFHARYSAGFADSLWCQNPPPRKL